MEEIKRQERKKGTFRKEELLEKFIAKKLFEQLDKRYNEKYQAKLERNWRHWKGGRVRG